MPRMYPPPFPSSSGTVAALAVVRPGGPAGRWPAPPERSAGRRSA
ncbi:hypothetical protein SSTG_06008 [Streptomyces sp. e14]|nr:hypothetical protein SSTG_06008 [Streptomyces sp. e14]